MYVIQCYPPTNDAEEESKTSLFDSPQHILKNEKTKEVTRVMVDMKAKTESDSQIRQYTTRWQTTGE